MRFNYFSYNVIKETIMHTNFCQLAEPIKCAVNTNRSC